MCPIHIYTLDRCLSTPVNSAIVPTQHKLVPTLADSESKLRQPVQNYGK